MEAAPSLVSARLLLITFALVPHLHPLGSAVERGDDRRELLLRQLGAEHIERAFEFERRQRAE